MTKVVENIPQKKIKTVQELTNLAKEKKTILIADISTIPGSQFQQISKKLRGKAIVKVPKKNLFSMSLENSEKKEILELKDKFVGASAVLFSDLDSFELAALLLKIRSPSKAKPGQIAPIDIEVPEGPTDLVPGPAISELGALGIQIQIQGGKIHIKEPKVIAKEGEAISGGAASILSKLGIQPFTIGFKPLSVFDANDGKVYSEINIDEDFAREELVNLYRRGLALAVSIGYNTKETVPLRIRKAAMEENRLIRVINGEPEEVTTQEEAVPAEETKQEEKKEASVDFGGFF